MWFSIFRHNPRIGRWDLEEARWIWHPLASRPARSSDRNSQRITQVMSANKYLGQDFCDRRSHPIFRQLSGKGSQRSQSERIKILEEVRALRRAWGFLPIFYGSIITRYRKQKKMLWNLCSWYVIQVSRQLFFLEKASGVKGPRGSGRKKMWEEV